MLRLRSVSSIYCSYARISVCSATVCHDCGWYQKEFIVIVLNYLRLLKNREADIIVQKRNEFLVKQLL